MDAGDAAVGALGRYSRRIARTQRRAPAAVFALFRIGTPKARAAVRAALSDPNFEVRTAAARMRRDGAGPRSGGRLMEIVKKGPPGAAAAGGGGAGADRRSARPSPALLEAAASAEDRFVEHSIIYSLITLRQSESAGRRASSAAAGVRKAALIALDQMDGSPLRQRTGGRVYRRQG